MNGKVEEHLYAECFTPLGDARKAQNFWVGAVHKTLLPGMIR
jgi:hypothetical protein